MKKFLCFILSVMMVAVCCLTASCGKDKATTPKDIPSYVTNRDESKVFKIASWVGIPNYVVELDGEADVVPGSAREMTDEEFLAQYQVFKESGIQILYPGEWKCSIADGGPYSGKFTSDAKFIQRMLDAANKVGIKQMIRDYTLNGILKNTNITDEEAVTAAKKCVESYIDDPALFGHLIEDEPILNEMEVARMALRRYKMAFPDTYGLVNLCPIIGQAKDFVDDNYDPETDGIAYEYYLDSFMEGNDFTDYISYDHYPLFGNNTTGRTSLEPTFLYSMELVGSRARAAGKEMWTYLQSIGYGHVNRMPTSVGDIGFQAYSFMAYGGHMISWFCYWSPVRYDGMTHFTPAMIELDGSKTDVYDYVRTINEEILSFDDIYFNFEYQGVMTKLGTNNKIRENDNFAYIENTVLNSHARIKKTTAEEDTLIGTFKDGEGRDGFMVVNFSDPGQHKSSNVEMTFNDAGFAVVCQNGKVETVTLDNGVLKLALDSGDGAFVIPIN